MKETINNLLDSEEYTRQLEERRISNTNKVKIRLNEILDSNLEKMDGTFNIYLVKEMEILCMCLYMKSYKIHST